MSARKFLRGMSFVALVLASVTAHAQLFRAYLSIAGSDANPCTVVAPCRLLPAALAAVAPGGEIWMLDSANYNAGTVDIAKSVTILGVPGAVASVVATGGGAAIHIATAGVEVTLRNLLVTRNVNAAGSNGVVMNAGARLAIEKCVFAYLPSIAISVSGPVKVWISDSIIANGGNAGLAMQNGGVADISNSKFVGNALTSIYLIGSAPGTTTSATISDSVLAANSEGLNVVSSSGIARASVLRSTLSNNTYGVTAHGANTAVTVSGSLVTRNGTGLRQLSLGTLETLGNNVVRQNTTNTSGTITPVAPM